MALKYGATTVSTVYYGTTQLRRVNYGNTLVYGRSYVIRIPVYTGAGVASVTVRRTSSPMGAATGVVSDLSIIYEGDTLTVSATFQSGYKLDYIVPGPSFRVNGQTNSNFFYVYVYARPEGKGVPLNENGTFDCTTSQGYLYPVHVSYDSNYGNYDSWKFEPDTDYSSNSEWGSSDELFCIVEMDDGCSYPAGYGDAWNDDGYSNAVVTKVHFFVLRGGFYLHQQDYLDHQNGGDQMQYYNWWKRGADDVFYIGYVEASKGYWLMGFDS